MAIIKLQGESEKRRGLFYEVDSDMEPIGEGGTGKVYEGRCINTKTGETRPVAIKFMFADLPEQIVERARRESSIQLRNDNLVEMLGFIETESYVNNTIQKHYHVVSELLHGVSLTDIFDGKCTDAKGREIPYAKKLLNIYSKDPDHFAKIITINVLSGLMALHDAGYIHRDIDPSNIMITDDNHIKLIDFGICKQMDKLTTHDKVQTVAGVFMGKPEYASPELALGDIKHQNQTSDIYAVGILMYQCMLGHVPFEGTRYEILDKQVKVKLPAKNIKNVRLRRIVEKACDKKQELRYQTSAEMRVDLESLDIKRVMDPRKKRMLAIAAVCAILVIFGGLGSVYWYSSHKEAEHKALVEKNTRDSLVLIVKTSVKQAEDYANKGYMHDEGYDKYLVEAKRCYDKADEAVGKLETKDASFDYSQKKQKLVDALVSARDELSVKADVLQSDSDPIVVEESKLIRKRIEEIEKVLQNK
ncbi:MAG: serine/threonine-protein kinase [Prevotellaceae bacterium]|nr:serine/threonine-protein kinase [Prevotellaceae bacterium]